MKVHVEGLGNHKGRKENESTIFNAYHCDHGLFCKLDYHKTMERRVEMKELTAIHKDGFKIKSLIESSCIVPTISDLRIKGFKSFIIKTVANINPESYQWQEGFQWLSLN